MVLDILIKDGRVVDGCGNPWFKADVGIEDGRIVEVGRLGSAGADRVVQASGLVVSPGFIDIHSHSDSTLLINPRAESLVRQGVTLDVIGNCGFTLAPMRDETRKVLRDNMAFPMAGLELGWHTFREYLEEFEKRGVALNVASLVGHGTVRIAVMGLDRRKPSGDELGEMKALVEEAMEAGAFGLSSGLPYPPGFYAEKDELIELCKVVARFGGIYATHIRGEGLESFLPAIREAIEIGEAAGLPVQVSHIETHYPAWSQMDAALSLVDDARAGGIDVACDVPPYLWSYTGLYTLLPDWVHEGGGEALAKRLRDPDVRQEIAREMRVQEPKSVTKALVKDGRWDWIILSACEKSPELVGKSLAEATTLLGREPIEAVLEILSMGPPFPSIILKAHNEEDIRKVLRHKTSMPEVDLFALAPYGPLAEGRNHPRGYGTFPLVFRKYVRGETRPDMPMEEGAKVLTLEEAVRKMTSLPAQRLSLKDRGLIREGMYADITIFNPETITDRATYEQPDRYPEGVEYVIVNGRLVVERGEHTGALAGKVLRRP